LCEKNFGKAFRGIVREAGKIYEVS